MGGELSDGGADSSHTARQEVAEVVSNEAIPLGGDAPVPVGDEAESHDGLSERMAVGQPQFRYILQERGLI